jgi:hypothetical protein
MAFDKHPSAMFAGYSSDGTNITIPIANIAGLTVTEANAVSGDLREIAHGICTTIYLYYSGLPTEDKPSAFKAVDPTRYAQTSGSLSGSFKETFQFQFWTSLGLPSVVEEPV